MATALRRTRAPTAWNTPHVIGLSPVLSTPYPATAAMDK